MTPLRALMLLLAATTTAAAQVPNPDYVQAVAIYRVDVGVSDDLPDVQVNYNVTDPAVIAGLFAGIESDTMRDCELLETINSAIVYVKYDDDTREVFWFFLEDTYFSHKGARGRCYYVNPPTRDIVETYAQ